MSGLCACDGDADIARESRDIGVSFEVPGVSRSPAPVSLGLKTGVATRPFGASFTSSFILKPFGLDNGFPLAMLLVLVLAART
jgi:hypothetical protein